MNPLHDARTRPLSAHAQAALKAMLDRPVPRQELNPGLAGRLLRETLVESCLLPSPYRTHAGKKIEHLRITQAGISAMIYGRD